MKKILISILLISMIGIGYLGYRYNTDRFFMRRSRLGRGVGHSMEPTLPYDSIVNIYKAKMQDGDVISFSCSAERCHKWGTTVYDGEFQKRLIKIREDGAIWVDGDNKDNSFDSDYFGWLMPNEFSDVWVVKLQ